MMFPFSRIAPRAALGYLLGGVLVHCSRMTSNVLRPPACLRVHAAPAPLSDAAPATSSATSRRSDWGDYDGLTLLKMGCVLQLCAQFL